MRRLQVRPATLFSCVLLLCFHSFQFQNNALYWCWFAYIVWGMVGSSFISTAVG